MKKSQLLRIVLALVLMVVWLLPKAQVTTATISGTVTTKDGKPLNAATVQIAFPDAGITKSVVTQSNGSYLVPNLR
jgi:hypothetical protein